MSWLLHFPFLCLYLSDLISLNAAIIYPSLKQLEDDMALLKENKNDNQPVEVSIMDEERKLSGKDPTEDEECGICMEACTEAVLPNCGHSMCITCFENWY